MLPARRTALLALLVMTLGVASTASPAVARTVPPSVTAQRLARAYHSAGTTAKRKAAILDIARTVHLGVYKAATLATIVRGVARANGPYLYDVEITGLAQATNRKARLSFDDIAATLSLESASDVTPITGLELQAASRTGVTRALTGRTRGASALIALLADDLAKADGVNLRSVAPGATSLDPLIGVLAVADVAVPLAASQPRATSRVASPRAANPCEALSGGAAGSGGFGKWLIPQLISDVAGKRLNALFVGTDAIHGIALAYSMGFSEKTESGENATGFGFAGVPRAGKPIKLKAFLEMRDHPSVATIRCGALLGYTIPPHGGVSGARVTWKLSRGREPSDLGVVQCPANGCESTDGDGISTWQLQPDDELLPGQGTFVTEQGVMTASVAYQGASGNVLGGAAELAFQKEVITGWTVRWHQPEGYHFSLGSLPFTARAEDGHAIDERYSFTGMDECAATAASPHPTYTTTGGIGLLPGTDASGTSTERIDHEAGQDVASSSSSRPFIILTPPIPPGRLTPGTVTTRNDWAIPFDDAFGASIDAGWTLDGLVPKMAFTFNVPGASPGSYIFNATPSPSELCAAARPFISSGR